MSKKAKRFSRNRSGLTKQSEQKAHRDSRWVWGAGVVGGVLLVACGLSLLTPKCKKPAASQSELHRQLGEFSAATAAESEIEALLARNDADIDLGLANWLVAADVPQFTDLRREQYFK